MTEVSFDCYVIELTRQVVFGYSKGIPMYRRDEGSTPWPRYAKRYNTHKEAHAALPNRYFPNAKVWRYENNKLEEVTDHDNSNTSS